MTLNMKKIIVAIFLLETVFNLVLMIKYIFGIGGMTQSRYLHLKPDVSISNPSNYFGIKRTYFNMYGKLNDGLFSFLIQTNFSESFPLLDAWAGYHPNDNLSFFFGQKLSPLNNLSMQTMEYDLQFASRNYLSQNFSNLEESLVSS